MSFLKKLFSPSALIGKVLIGIGIATGQPWLIATGANMTLGSVLERKPKAVRRLMEQSVMIRSAVQPQDILYGRDKKSGVVVFFGTSPPLNENLWYVVAIVEHEIDGFEKLWIDDVAIDVATEIDGTGYVTNPAFIDADGNKLVQVWLRTGTDDQLGNPILPSAFTEWTSDHRGRGVADVVVRMILDRSAGGTDVNNPDANVWSKGYPRDIAVTARGKKVYDPRKDSTNGGSGSHRADDPSTWEWSDNPILCRTDYLRSSRFGPGYDVDEIDWDTVIAHANAADVSVTVDDDSPPTTQKRYTLNGVVSVEDTPRAVLEAMQTADHGKTLFPASGIAPRVGMWDAPSHTIDPSWLAGDISMVSATEADDAYNAVRGQYVSAAEDYALIEFKPRLSTAFETEDGRRSWQDILLPFTRDEYSAQRLAITELKKSRQQTVVNLPLNFRGELVGAYQTVTLSGLDEFNGSYRVIGKSCSQDGTVSLQLRQEAESDWTFDIPDLAAPPVVPSVTRNPDGVPAPSALTASTGPEGVRLAWTLPQMSAVSHIEVYASATNSRSAATLVTRTRSETFFHDLEADTERYYWILARGINGLTSEWHPSGATDGVLGVAGAAGQGPKGDDGAPALDGLAEVDGPVTWVRLQDGTTWAPTAATSDVLFRFVLAGTDVARVSRRVTRAADGSLTVSTITAPGGNLNTSRVTMSAVGHGTRGVTVRAHYNHDGHVKTLQQGWVAALSGADGAAGLSVAELYIFRRASSAPATPTGGSYSFTTQTLTPPAGWSVGIPAGTDPVYVSVTSAAIVGQTGQDDSLTWSAPVLMFRDGTDGQAVDMIFRRSASQPLTPAPSSGVPSGWFTDVNSVPGGSDPLWSAVGTRPNPTANWTWQAPIKVEGVDGEKGEPGPDSLLFNGGFESGKTAPWQSSSGGGGLGILSTIPRTGTYAGWVPLAQSTSASLFFQIITPPPAGEQLRLTAYALRSGTSPPNRNVRLVARFGDTPGGGGTTLDTIVVGSALSTVSGWQQITGVVTVPAGAQALTFRLEKVGPHNTDETGIWVFDDCAVHYRPPDGLSVAELTIYRRSASAPSTPSGGSFNFETKVLTPPSGWFISAPSSGTNPVYISRGTATIIGQTGTAAPVWAAPELAAGIFAPISVDDFAAGIEPVSIHVGSEPAGTYLGTDVVLWTNNGKLYRWGGSSYSKAIDDEDIVELAADKITAGTINAAITMTNNLILSTSGRAYTAGKTTVNSATAGVFMGWESGSNYGLAVGDATKGIRYRMSDNTFDIYGGVVVTGSINPGAVTEQNLAQDTASGASPADLTITHSSIGNPVDLKTQIGSAGIVGSSSTSVTWTFQLLRGSTVLRSGTIVTAGTFDFGVYHHTLPGTAVVANIVYADPDASVGNNTYAFRCFHNGSGGTTTWTNRVIQSREQKR